MLQVVDLFPKNGVTVKIANHFLCDLLKLLNFQKMIWRTNLKKMKGKKRPTRR